MQFLVLFALCLSAVFAAPAGEDGRYYHDYTGHYVHNPDEGKYVHDDAGNYRHTNAGDYSHVDLGYTHIGGPNDGAFGNNKGGKGSGPFGNGNLVGAGTFENPRKVTAVAPPRPTPPPKPRVDPNATAKPTTPIPRHTGYDGNWKILRQIGEHDLDGYHWEYLTENKINAEETGKLHNKGTDDEAMKAFGFYTYTGPDNVVYYVKYTADENGFVPEGDHIPTPPPIPEAIVRALEYQKSIGAL